MIHQLHSRSMFIFMILTFFGSMHSANGQESRRNTLPTVRVQIDRAARSYAQCVVKSAEQKLKNGEARGAAAYARTKCEPVFLRVERTILNLTKDRQFANKEAEKIRNKIFITTGTALLTASATAKINSSNVR